MAKNIMDKFLNFIGFEDAEPQEEEPVAPEAAAAEEIPARNRRAAVVNLHTQKQARMVLIEPTSFEEAQGIADHLKNHKSIIVNLETADKDLAKRIVDFVSGATYALGGNMQKISAGIFLFAPSNIEITGSMREEINETLSDRVEMKPLDRGSLFRRSK